MSLRVLIIKTGTTVSSIKARGEDFEDWFADGMNLKSSEVLVRNGHLDEPLPAPGSIDGVIITGSPAYVTDLAEWNFVLAGYCRTTIAHGIPVLGVCYGHQLLAWAFGGRVGFTPGGREIGTVSLRLEEAAGSDPLFSALPPGMQELKVQVSHLQSVLELPPQATRLAGNAHDSNQAFRIGANCWGIQFHPEFTAEITRAYINERSGEIRAEGLNPEALLGCLAATPEAASLLGRFVEIAISSSSSRQQVEAARA